MKNFKINFEGITAIVNCQLSIVNFPPIIGRRYNERLRFLFRSLFRSLFLGLGQGGGL